MLKRAVTHPLVRRLTLREYMPFATWLATWAMIGFAIGHADTARLFAANTFLQSLRSLCAFEMTAVMVRRLGDEEAYRKTRSKALRVDLLSLLATIILALLLAAFLWWRDMGVAAAMVLLIGLLLPARHPGMVLSQHRQREATWRTGAAATGVIGAALLWKFGGEWWHAALLIALRDWVGLLFTFAFGPPRAQAAIPLPEPMRFAEIAARTEFAARRRLTYRIVKSLLGGVMGPFGSLIARTGRGAGLDARINRLIPRHRPGMIGLTLASSAVMVFFLMIAREPATLVLASAASRIATSGGTALLWWNYAMDFSRDEDDEDE